MSYYYHNWKYCMDNNHGFGICYTDRDCAPDEQRAFFEDGAFETLSESKRAISTYDLERILGILPDYSDDNRSYRFNTSTTDKVLDMAENSTCEISVGKDKNSLEAVLKTNKKSYTVKAGKFHSRYGFSYQAVCSCKDSRCLHVGTVGTICGQRLRNLQHMYVTTSQPVNKSILIEYNLRDNISQGILAHFAVENMEDLHVLVDLLNSAKSRDYYWAFHRYMLSLDPGYYDAHYLERYLYLYFALFEEEGFQDAVIRPGGYADPESYEGRQHRSNRASFKRMLKEYESTRKELDQKGNLEEDVQIEFLLKYRGDETRLLEYLACHKETLEEEDLGWLERIAKNAEAGTNQICMVAEKMDSLARLEGSRKVFDALVGRLSHQEMVNVYSRLTNISLPLEEIRSLPEHEQEKLIYNTPLTRESFLYIMKTLLKDKPAKDKGQFILSTLPKVAYTQNPQLKKSILEQACALPSSRLLSAYVCSRLNLDGKYKEILPQQGDPREELSTYFSGDYTIQNNNSSFEVHFEICDPVENFCLIDLVERKQEQFLHPFHGMDYPADLVKAVCLAGKEEIYAKAIEQIQDSVDSFNFEANHRKFASAYRKLCESFQEEKILFRAAEKAGIEWLLYREEGSNALAFRVGNTKKYVVKEANAFLQAFRSGQTIQYGKDLILTHDPDNFNETDGALIKLLLAAKHSMGRKSDKKNKRYITVNDGVMASLFEQLSGQMVSYNDQPCHIRLQMQKVRLKIDGNYALSTDLQEGGQEFLNLLGKGYVLTRGQKDLPLVLDRVEGNAEEIGLIEMVDQNPGVSIKPILKDFKKNIYGRFFELFDVDQAVAPSFRLSTIRLNTYFDYEKGIITQETKIYKDEKLLAPNRLTERMDLVKYELLKDYLSDLGFEDGRLEDDSRILSFFKMDFTRLKTLTNVYLSDNLQNKELKSIGRPVVRVTYKNNILQAFLEKSEYSEEELEKILTAIRKKKKFILLNGDRLVDLDSETARDFAETVRDMELNPKDLYEKKKISMVTAIKAFAHEKSCKADKYLRDMIDEIRSFKEADLTLPKLKGQLRDYQKEGFFWLSILTKYGMGGILADDMGLGKTLQVIALIKADAARKPSLIVCPKSLVFNWVSEFARFDGKTEVVEIYGPDSVRSERIAAINYKKKAVYVTSYDSLRNDIGKYTGEFNYAILDEAQYIKNVHAQKTKSVKELKAAHRFALTGTPIENSVVDLWSIFDYIMPGYFEELSHFKDSDTAVIARKAGPFILRRVKEDVLEDLPPKYERILSADMSEGQRKLYDAMRLDAQKRLEEGGKAFDILPYLTRLRQICVDPGMFVEGYAGSSGKLELLEGLIPEYLGQNHRILIFSQFVKALEAVDQILKKHGISSYFLSGATPAKERIAMMDSFNNGSGVDVFLVSLKAGGTGLNLTGADTVIHLDPWWNVAAENQASDRTHRIGQKRNVEVIKLIAGDSIEQRVVELQDMKKEVINQVISDDDGSVTSASLEDIAFVLG